MVTDSIAYKLSPQGEKSKTPQETFQVSPLKTKYGGEYHPRITSDFIKNNNLLLEIKVNGKNKYDKILVESHGLYHSKDAPLIMLPVWEYNR